MKLNGIRPVRTRKHKVTTNSNHSLGIAAIFQHLNGFYNTRRRHSYLGGISPLAFEAKVA